MSEGGTSITGVALEAHVLEFVCEAQTVCNLPLWTGPIIRGALSDALRSGICASFHPSANRAPYASCPLCNLLATTDENNERGVELPRLFAVRPTTGPGGTLLPGRRFRFGVTLFGESVQLFPFLNTAVQQMGATGFISANTTPGRFRVREVWCHDPLSGERRQLASSDSARLARPSFPISNTTVLQFAETRERNAVVLDLRSPLRLISDGRLVQTLTFANLLRRILRRLDQLTVATTGNRLVAPFTELIEMASTVEVLEDETRWVDVFSHSSRTKRSTPIGGLVGRITFTGELTSFLPWLAWGQICQVGKDTTKGNGWIELSR